ncbi:MAG: exonuclease SbcCD subunit D [Eubacteriales bacterium]|nr:exonuclease SbcCD subunit D [Eubacteriales bacterium]
MRLLHAADLHLGKKLCEAALLADQRWMLNRLLEIAAEEKADALLIAGDVYDKSVPPAEAVGLLDEFLTRLSESGVPAFVTSGNHDSAERLAFAGRLLTARQIYLSHAYDAAHASPEPILLRDEFGEAAVHLLPYLKPAHVRAAFPEARIETYTDALRQAIDCLPVDASRRNVLVCHQLVTGARRSESEELSIGGLDNVDASVFAPFDYVALGHLHHAQSIGGDAIHYAGSPLKYSFGEANDEKSVTLAELGPKGTLNLRMIPLTPPRALRELHGSYAELTLRENYVNTQTDDYLHVTLTDEDDVPEAMAKLRTIYPNLLKLDYDNARTRGGGQSGGTDEADRRSPLELLEQFYEEQNHQPMSGEQRAYALKAMERIREERA